MFAFLHLSYIQRVGLEGSKILDLFLFSLIIYPGNLTNCKSLELVIYWRIVREIVLKIRREKGRGREGSGQVR